MDQVIRIAGKGEWVAKTKLDFRGRVYPYPWIQLDWEEPIYTNQVILYDRVDKDSHTAAVRCSLAMEAQSRSTRFLMMEHRKW